MEERRLDPAVSARVVWLAMVSSVAIYAVVGWLLGRLGTLPLVDRVPVFLTPAFALAALALAGTAVVAQRVLVTVGPASPAGGSPFAALLVGWALCESIAVLGFAHHLLFARPLVSGALMGAALALLILQRPSVP
ncbi:MAG TPA: hypothetical protein VMV46_08265 [Thermoanaerobaculia bacterium]|nr:hypothetical protein [Thermoanaerobaculia bacterium]